ncbi:MAG: glycosyltransferase family 39 protein [Vicinamibacteria bacterium]
MAAALRFTGLSWDLRHTPHVDERYFVENVALMLSEGDFDYRFYEYPGFFFYLLYPVLAVVGASVPADATAYLAARGLVAAFGVLSVGLVYFLGTRVAGPTTGLVAAFFLAVSPVEVQTAHSVRPDVVLEAFVLLALLVFATVGEPSRRDVASGIALGSATAVKFSGVLLVPSYLAYRLLSPGPYLRRMLLAGGISLVTFLALSPYTLLNAHGFFDGVLTQVGYHYGGSIGAGDYLGRLWTYLGHPQGTLRKAFGTIGVLLVVAGLFPAGREWRKWLPLLLFPILMVAVFSTSLVHHDRFLVPTLGVLALLGGKAAQWLTERSRVTFALVLVALAFPFYASTSYVRAVSRPSTRDRALDWIETNLRPGARVVSSLTDLGSVGSTFELMSLASSSDLFGLQVRNADAALLRPADEAQYDLDLPLTMAFEPESEFSGPPLNLYVVPDNLRPRYEPIPLEASWLTASESSERLPNLIDGRLTTYWGTGGAQRPGNWIQIQLSEPIVVARVELSLGRRPLRGARELRLEGRTEDAWIEIPYVMGRAGVQGQFLDENGASQVLLFEPTLLRGVRLFQTGRRTRSWSIAELRLYQSLTR